MTRRMLRFSDKCRESGAAGGAVFVTIGWLYILLLALTLVARKMKLKKL